MDNLGDVYCTACAWSALIMNDFGMDSSKATVFSEPADILRKIHSKMEDMAPWALWEPRGGGGGQEN